MSSWLVWTGFVELANIAIFSWLAVLLVGLLAGPGDLTLIGVATLDLLLLQGGLYWLGKRWRVGRSLGPRTRIRLLLLLYAANAPVLLAFPLVAASRLVGRPAADPTDLMLGLAFYLFALGEFIHYFVVKINMRRAEREMAGRTGHRPTARFRRELARARAGAAEEGQADVARLPR